MDLLVIRKTDELREKKKTNPKFKFSTDPTQIRNSIFNDAFQGLLYEDKENNGKTQVSYRAKTKLNPKDIHKQEERDFEIPLSN